MELRRKEMFFYRSVTSSSILQHPGIEKQITGSVIEN